MKWDSLLHQLVFFWFFVWRSPTCLHKKKKNLPNVNRWPSLPSLAFTV